MILRADAEVPIICDNFKVILEKIRSANATAEILFLECPMYSIEMWNEIKEHGDPTQFKTMVLH